MARSRRSTPLIRRLVEGEPAVEICARWRHEAFFEEDGVPFEVSAKGFRDFVARQSAAPDDYEIALLAEVDGKPAGFCLLVEEEIDQAHELSPWLASLYVAPAYRRQGIATALIRAIEAQARKHGFWKIYLYTVDAEALYWLCGWESVERVTSGGHELLLMERRL